MSDLEFPQTPKASRQKCFMPNPISRLPKQSASEIQVARRVRFTKQSAITMTFDIYMIEVTDASTTRYIDTGIPYRESAYLTWVSTNRERIAEHTKRTSCQI